jgi:hypothetical protein
VASPGSGESESIETCEGIWAGPPVLSNRYISGVARGCRGRGARPRPPAAGASTRRGKGIDNQKERGLHGLRRRVRSRGRAGRPARRAWKASGAAPSRTRHPWIVAAGAWASGPPGPAFLVGCGILRALALVPILRALVWFAALAFGFGVPAVAIAGSRHRPGTRRGGVTLSTGSGSASSSPPGKPMLTGEALPMLDSAESDTGY